MEEKEVWRDIEGYEGLYQVSSWGNVKSLGNGKSNNKNYCKERILKAGKAKIGYLYVYLMKDGVGKTCRVNRLVAKAFLPNPSNLPIINHKDENKLNNNVNNLEWCSYSYNNTYNNKAKKIGEKLKGKKQSKEHVRKRAEKLRGRKKSKESVRKRVEKTSKPIVGVHIFTGEKVFFPSISEASKQLGISHGNICACCKGKRHSAGNYTWHYLEDQKEANE